MDMRGLAHFIRDIRKVTTNKDAEQQRIDEELGKIRSKFKDSNGLSTYDRRKYVCKLMFVSMLGYPVTFGHMEGVQLLALSGPAEKLIGYLSLTVFLHEGHELMTLTNHVVTMDLLSGKDLNTTLALTAVANVGGRDYCETMGEHVRNMILKTGNVQLRKKGLLTYLRIWKKCRDAADISTIVPVAIEWITHPQFGLACAAITFLTGIIAERAEQPELFAKVPAAITKLLGKIILEKHTEPEYIYYGVPAPWLQAKALRLLQYFPPPTDETRSMLLSIVSKILKATEKVVKDSQSLQKQRGTANRCNAMNASLVELVSLVIQWELDTKMLTECTNFVNTFVNDKKDANMRYIGLLLLSRLSLVTSVPGFDFAGLCKQFQTQVAVALHDPDISLRKKSLVLTYSICTAQNADEIVTELLRFLPAAGGTFKRDLALFIVAIAEKFAADVTWYVDTVFAVLASAGEHLPEGIWHRLCVLIINTPSAQKHAVELVYLRVRALLNPYKGTGASTSTPFSTLPESVVRVSAVLLGEFGYQIALSANASPVDQVMTLQSLLVNTTNATKGMILTALVKAYNLFDGTVVREKIVKSIGQFVGNIDPELQQRAVEYLALIKNASDETLQSALEALPPMELEMGSIFQLIDGSSGDGGTNDGDLWIQKVHDRDLRDAATSSALRQQQQTTNPESPVTSLPSESTQQLYALSSPLVAPALVGAHADPMAGVASAPMTAQQADTLDDLFSFVKKEGSPSPSSSSASARADINDPSPEVISRWFRALCAVSSRGVLYEDSFISVQAMYEYRNADVRLALTLTARSGALHNISAKLASTSAALLVQSRDHAPSCGDKESMKVEFAARSLAPFTDSPAMRLQYTPSSSAAQRSVVLSLPILSCGFCAPYKVEDIAKAEALWANTPAGDAGKPFTAEYRSPKLLDDKDVTRVLQHLKLFVVALPTSGQNGGGEYLGVGAHATQSGANTQFSPLLVRVRLVPSSGVLQVLIKNTSSLLQASMWDAMKWGLELAE
jgi:AP-2 complex subunit alpha